MPRSRGSAPLHLKTTSSAESNGVHHRPIRDRSPKLEEHRRSPRSPLPEVGVCNQKKRGSRVSDLETRLGHAQEELRKLKEQLASAEAAKRDAQQELEETKKQIPVAAQTPDAQEPVVEGEHPQIESGLEQQNGGNVEPVEELPVVEMTDPVVVEDSVEVTDASDAVEAPVELVVSEPAKEDGMDDKSEEKAAEEGVEVEEEQNKPVGDEEVAEAKVAARTIDFKLMESPEEMLELETRLWKKENELESCLAENASLKKQLVEAESDAAASRTKQEEMASKMKSLEEELGQSRANGTQLGEQLEALGKAKTALETEMKKLRVQTDQWRKAADAAAAIISADEVNGAGRRVAERCGSMDKHVVGGYDAAANALLGSPLMGGEHDDGLGGGKRKGGGGIRMFGDLWKKKGQHK